MKNIIYVLLLFSTVTFGQKTINDYKYIIVPSQFNFFNVVDKYQTSSLTKFLFNKHGFKAFLSDEKLPEDLAQNRCLGLTANVKNNSGMFTTKNIIELRDCNNNLVFESQEGRSKQKEYKKSYHEAIRNAFKSIQNLKYKYVSDVNEKGSIVKKNTQKIVEHPKVIETKPVVSNKTENILYAQPIDNGFQLINKKPEVVYQLLKTNLKDVFVIKNRNGILYKAEAKWIAEYYINGNKKTEFYQIKF